MTESMSAAKHDLQVSCFADVDINTIYEYFVAESIGSVLTWSGDDLVGCVSVFGRALSTRGVPFCSVDMEAHVRDRTEGTRASAHVSVTGQWIHSIAKAVRLRYLQSAMTDRSFPFTSDKDIACSDDHSRS